MVTTRYLTLYINVTQRVAEVRIRRANDPTTGSRSYHVQGGQPSAKRLGRLLAGRRHTHYPAQTGWGTTGLNGRARDVYVFREVNQ